MNNDFYREKQAELRKEQVSCSQQPTEVVCLDDDDEEEVYYAEESQKESEVRRELLSWPVALQIIVSGFCFQKLI